MIENIIFYLLDKKWSGVREGGHLVSCLRRKRDYVVAPEFIGGPTSLPTGNRAPSGAVIFSRISVFVAKKHSRSILLMREY